MYLGEYRIDDYVLIAAQLHRFSSGAVYAPTGDVHYTIYENDTDNGPDGNAAAAAHLANRGSKTGLYTARVQLTAASGYEAGKDYLVLIEATVDGVAAAEVKSFRVVANPKVDMDTIKTNPVVNGGTVTFPTNKTLAATDNITAASGVALSSTGADLILKSSTFVQAIVAAINEFATYGLTALNTLLVTTGIKAATIPAATLAASQHVIVDSGTITAIPNATVGGYAAGQDPVTLMNATPPDVNVKTETNHDFTALQKTSLNAATPAVSVANGGIQALSFAANAINAAALDPDAGTEISAAVWAAAIRTLTSAASFQVKKNTQLNAFPLVMTDAVNHEPMAGLAATAVRSIDGGAFGACANAVIEIANGWYKITLAAADLNGTTIALRFTAAGADDLNLTFVTQA